MRITRRILAVIALAALCAPAPVCFAGKVKLPNDIAWVYVADTYKCCVQQAYLNAARRLRELAKDEKPGAWCVVLDADETIISNVQFQIDLVAKGVPHSKELWDEWCMKGKATALPGAKEFCALVRELGGKVIIITNRQGPVKEATLRNLDALGFTYDACLLRDGPYAMDRSKTMRRADVEKGEVKTLPEGKRLPPLKILMLAGDQTHDLYSEKAMGFEDVKERFGRDFVMIPNPMYGDWIREAVYADADVPAAAPEVEKAAAPAAGGVLTPDQAKGKIGEEVVVEGTVVKVHTRERGPDMLNFDKNWREGLSVAVFKKEKFGDLKEKYEGKKIRVKGEVTEYKNRPQIKVDDPSQIEVVGPGEAAPPASGGVLTPDQAKGKIGEEVVVEGTVVKVHTRERGPDMLNFDENWREGLSVAVFKKEKFGDLKEKYEGKKIRVKGKVTEYKGQSQIKVSELSQIELVQ